MHQAQPRSHHFIYDELKTQRNYKISQKANIQLEYSEGKKSTNQFQLRLTE